MDGRLTQDYSEKLEYLRGERIRVLREINVVRISTRSEHKQNDKLSRLADDYNRLMDQIDDEESNFSSLSDPLEALPIEIWQEIITMTRDGLPTNLWEIEHILPLTLVSKSWRQAIMTTPIFWTYIQLFSPCYDMEAKVATCLRLSSDLPLNICLQVSNAIGDAIIPILKGQGYRIKGLSLLQDYSSATGLEPTDPTQSETFLSMLLETAGEMTALEELCFYGSIQHAPWADRILQNATQLQALECMRVSSESLQLDSVKKLRRLVTYTPLHQILPFISGLQDLDHVGLFNEGRFGSTLPTTPTYTPQANYMKKSIAWRLSSLIMDDHPNDLGWHVLNETFSSLNHLRISFSWAKLPDFIAASFQMVRLSELTMTLPISLDNYYHNLPSVIHQIPIQYLYLTIKADDYILNSNEDAISRCEVSAKRLVDILISWAPDVDRLSLYTPIDHTFSIPYIQSLKKLSSLTASRSNRSSYSSSQIELPSVKSLDFTGRTSIFSAFSYPEAADLSLVNSEDYTGGDFVSVYESFDRHPGTWHNLTSVEFGTQKENWTDLSLPRMKTMTMGGMSQKGLYLSPSILVALASKPDLFPSLSHLQLRWFPPWDILFIMLERRNFSTDSESTPITTLSFPSSPAPVVLRPLVSRLRRRLSKRPSNFDLSLQSIADAYFDAKL
jgi:hypothetical protein